MKLAIKGHATRGAEVIQLLEMLGGKNSTNYTGGCDNFYYYITEYGNIENTTSVKCYFPFTLDSFKFKYPYVVGERVLYLNDRNKWIEGTIENMKWDENNTILYYYIKDAGMATTMFMKPMKQKELKDYLKPGYVVEYEDEDCCVLTQDVHGNVFGIQIGDAVCWTSLEALSKIVAVYQIDKPCDLHLKDQFLRHTTKVWERPEVELTMQQIADKFGIDVNQLKIKK